LKLDVLKWFWRAVLEQQYTYPQYI